MRLIFWIVSMMFTISANASLNLDSLVPLKTKTPFLKMTVYLMPKGLHSLAALQY